jgi:hypothetical protein
MDMTSAETIAECLWFAPPQLIIAARRRSIKRDAFVAHLSLPSRDSRNYNAPASEGISCS